MSAFDNNLKINKMPSDADKQTDTLISEIKSGVPGNFTAVHAKLDEIINNRIIHNSDSDDIVQGATPVTRGGIRPHHAPAI